MPKKNRKYALLILIGVGLLFSFAASGKEKSCADECREETATCVKMCIKGVKQHGARGGEAEAAIAKCKEACREIESECIKDCSKDR